MSLEHRRFLGRFQASILNDIYLCSVLFYWRMHWDTNLSVSSAHVELCRHSCKIKPEFHLAFIKSSTKRKMTLYRDLIFCCSSLARLHFCRSLVSGPRLFGRSAGCLPVERKVIEHSHWTTGRLLLFFFPSNHAEPDYEGLSIPPFVFTDKHLSDFMRKERLTASSTTYKLGGATNCNSPL